MSNPGKLENKFFLVLRWIARIVGSLTALMIVFFGIAYSIEGDPPKASVVSIFVIWVVGVVLSWKWEGIGGGLLLLSSIIFYIFVPDALDWPPNPLIAFPITGILFLICWWKSRIVT